LAPAAADRRVVLAEIAATGFETMPPLAPGCGAVLAVGEKRSALLGTSSTSLRCDAVDRRGGCHAGARLRSLLSTSR